jgi:hypothetical protein
VLYSYHESGEYVYMRPLKITVLGFLAVSTLSLGCSSSDSSPASSTTASSAEDICANSWQRESSCEPDAGLAESSFVSNCKSTVQCIKNIAIDGYSDAFWTCANARPCNTSDDECASQLMQQLGTDPARKQVSSDCTVKHDQCKAAGTSFSDDYCAGALVANDSYLANLKACIAKDCAQVGSCLVAMDKEACPKSGADSTDTPTSQP